MMIGNGFANSTYGGCDINVAIGGKALYNVQAISYAVTRDKAPIHVMGDAAPVAFGRGKRAIAGSMVLVQGDQHGMMDIWNQSKFAADASEVAPWDKGEGRPPEIETAGFGSGDFAQGVTNFQTMSQNEATDWANGPVPRSPWYQDQLLPADITVYAQNEYGSASVLRMYGAEFLNEGWGMSVEDMNSETQSTYVARAIHPWTRIVNSLVSKLGTPPTGGKLT
jgi:hypothetical protein